MSTSFVDSPDIQNPKTLPTEFVWPENDVITSVKDLDAPLIDLQGFFNGDENLIQKAIALIDEACCSHGFFQVINHGVDYDIIDSATDEMDRFFHLPVDVKIGAKKIPGSVSGYSGAHVGRFSSKLPWKETLSFGFNQGPRPVVEDYIDQTLGKQFEKLGKVYQKYCEAVNRLLLSVAELLAMSLGVEDRWHYRKFLEDGSSILRCNFYPPCKQPTVTLGTGPHRDPTALTVLHQDQVGGLQIFADNTWQNAKPIEGALLVVVGETFTALTNGKYKSCLHRAVVNSEKERKSMAFFLSPREDKVIRPPAELLAGGESDRKYPDYTWSDLLKFTQSSYRADGSTLESFLHSINSAKKP